MISNAPGPWGSQTAFLRFAGQQYSFSGLTTGQKQLIDNRFTSGVSTKTDEPLFLTRMECADIPSQNPDHFTVNDFYTPQSRYRSSGLDVEGYGFRATVNLSASSECQLFAADEQLAVGPFIFENYLRVLAAYASLQQGGLFLHSAGIIINSKAYLFLGRSGAGKSTLSRLALEDGHTILSDDANIILPTANAGFQAGPVPFAGELGQVDTNFAQISPVAGVYWLEQSREASISQITSSLQTARVMTCCPIVNVDPFRLHQMLANVETLFQAVPLKVLHFRRDQPFSAIRQLIES